MRKKRPHLAGPSEVTIWRDGESAVIQFRDPDVTTTHLRIGPNVDKLSDTEILDRFNEMIMDRDLAAAQYHYVAVEIPVGKPQIQHFARGDQWTLRGDLLQCVIADGGSDGEPVIHIDERELSLAEIRKLLCTYAGWGMRIAFVPDDELEREPPVDVREPEPDT